MTKRKNSRVVIIAMDHPLDAEAHLKSKMLNAERRAERNADRFPGLDIAGMQREVHENLLQHQLFFAGHYMGVLDLLNYIRNDCRTPEYKPDNIDQYYLHAHMLTLNGVVLYQHVLRHGYDPVIIQNYSSVNPADIIKEKPLAVCISSTLTYLDDIKRIAGELKDLDGEVPIIVGGILVKKILHAGADLPPQTRQWISSFKGRVDAFVVEKCGEDTLVRVLDRLHNGDTLETVPNLALFDRDRGLTFTPRVEEIHHVDETALAWDRIPERFLRRTLSVLTSRGCNFRCRFCNYRLWFPKVQYKSIEVLRDELRSIQSLGFVRHVRFADDNLTTNRARLLAFLEMMLEEHFDFTWSAHARVNFLDPGTVEKMKRAGCDLLVMGIESGSRRLLDNMDKKITPEQAFEAVKTLEDHGIDSQSSFIIGYPGETEETFHKTVDLIKESGLKYWQAYLFYYATDMKVHEDREAFGLRGLGRAWKHATMDAVEASRLMARMVPLIETGYTDGQQNPWESYKLLRGEGYSREAIYRIHGLKRDLQLARQGPPGQEASPPERTEVYLDELKALTRKASA